jgi:hypothetical protein
VSRGYVDYVDRVDMVCGLWYTRKDVCGFVVLKIKGRKIPPLLYH